MVRHIFQTLALPAALGLFGISGLLGLSAPAGAQEGESQDLDVIKVTAEKRVEDVQKVPATVDVITSEEVERKGIRDFQALDLKVPNLVVNTSGAGTYSYFGIRGRVNNTGEMDPTVTVIVDGVPYSDFYTVTSMPLFDLERVEILKGPQSTLYGMNSEAGVINIVTRRPSADVPRASFGLSYGDGSDSQGSYMVRGAVSAPIVPETLALGFAFQDERKGGFLKNIAAETGTGETRTSGARLSAVFATSEIFKADLNVSYSQVRADNGYVAVPMNEAAALMSGHPSFVKWQVNDDSYEFARISNFSADLTMRLSLGQVDVVSVTAFREADQEYDADFDLGTMAAFYGPGVGMYGTIDGGVKTFLQELRFMSPDDSESSFSWMGGLFYINSKRDLYATMVQFTPLGEAGRPVMDNTLELQDFAIFGQVSARFFDDKLGLTLGLRQEWTRRRIDDNLWLVGREMEVKDSQLLPKASVDFRLTGDNMVYASAAMGWRPGGVFNTGMPNLTTSFVFTPEELRYEKEISWNYELGSKNTFLDGALRLNVALFYTKYRDYQDEYHYNTLNTLLKNAGEAEAKGAELEIEADLGEHLTLSGSLGLVKARYIEYLDDGGRDFSGNKIAGVPSYTASLGARIKFLDGFYVAPEVRFKGKTYWDRANLYHEDAYATLHLRAGWANENWEFYVYGDNLTNKYAFTRAMPFTSGVYLHGVPTRPLEVGVGLSYNY